MAKRIISTALALAATAALTLSGAGAAHGDNDGYQTRIIGGGTATEQYRFAAALQYKDPGTRPVPLRCGGALIHPQWVVTAAHCVSGRNPADYFITLGSNDYTAGTRFELAKFVVHPYWNTTNPENRMADIALIKLATPSTERPIRSARYPNVDPNFDVPVRMIGWGMTVDGDATSIPNQLRQLDTTLVPIGDCYFGDEYAATPGDLCVKRAKNDTAGACTGDSGSPLLWKVNGEWHVIGVTSRSGGETGCLNTDEVYTSTYDYWFWVTQNIES